jgi:hypothetical protein
MFRELTYEELGFVSGGKADTPPQEPPPPPPPPEVEGDTITVTADLGDGWFGSIEWEIPSWDLSALTIGLIEGGDMGSVTWDAGDGEISGAYSHDFGSATGTVEVFTGGQWGTGAMVRFTLSY